MGNMIENAGRHTRGVGRRCLLGVVLVAALAGACAPAGPPDLPPSKATLQQVKRNEFGQQALNESAQIAAGTRPAVLDFTVEDTPPSIFVNYVVPDPQVAAFAAAANLPPGFSLAKVRIIETDPVPQYWVSLNVYRVSGITQGLRAEWSTYVDDGSGVPRFMILRARASEGSVDPIGPLALPEPFQHTVGVDGVIRTAMKRTQIQNNVPVLTPDDFFNSTITLPDPVDRQYVVPTRQWVTANDYIYWLNGVNDRIFHDSSSHSAPLISVDVADVTLDDDTEWAPFVDPVPAHVLVYLDKIQFKIGPWWNVTTPDGRVAPATLASLRDLKKTMYGGLSSISALAVLSGTGEPIVQSRVEDDAPSVYWHWQIPNGQLADFEAALDLPPGLALTTVKLQDDDVAAAHWLSLRVTQVSGPSTGLRAEWSTYVDDGDATRTFTLEARASFAALDPVHLKTLPYPVTHTQVGDAVNTAVGSGPTAFSSSFLVPPSGPGTDVLAAREWVGTSDLRYWSNGVADRVFYDSTVFDPKTSVDPGSVSLTYGGPWAQFAGTTPDRVWVDKAGVDLVTNPWWNLNGL